MTRAGVTAAEREHPLMTEIGVIMGYTPALRLELCQAMNEQPPELGYRCDPTRYGGEAT